ncbi:hypothetical protein EVA_21219 [gut metagenome]|uniref:Minor fimbrium subunit Mfa1 C-terminal domain-containing protein n=1 Tax=gut metagenome TaxID=749906 RepID=J9FTI7_9ZZZZ
MNISRIFPLLLCGILFSCSDIEQENLPTDGMPDEAEATALLTLTLTMPQNGTANRTSALAKTDTEASQAGECKVSDALVILGKMADGLNASTRIDQKFHIDRFLPAGNPSQWSVTLLCKPGYYRILVIANPGQFIKLEDITPNWDALARRVISCKTWDELQSVWTDGHFLLTNAYQGRIDDFDVHLNTGEHSYKDIQVQRACARFDYQAVKKGNRYPLSCELDGQPTTLDIQLKEVALMNVSNNFNLFKQIAADNRQGTVPDFYREEQAFNYVYDSDWDIKRLFLLHSGLFEDYRLNEYFFYPSEQGRPNTPVTELYYHPLPQEVNGQDVRLMYCSENTIPGVRVQLNKVSTGLVFKGHFTLQNPPTAMSSALYARNLTDKPHLYTTLEGLRNALQQEGISLPETPTDTELAEWDILRFEPNSDGCYPVWYTYWNRHRDNGNSQQMGIMEFAVVRNNLYKLRVNSIRSLGLPQPPNLPDNPWKPAGKTPDEQMPQIDISVEVCDWTNRHVDHHI